MREGGKSLKLLFVTFGALLLAFGSLAWDIVATLIPIWRAAIADPDAAMRG